MKNLIIGLILALNVYASSTTQGCHRLYIEPDFSWNLAYTHKQAQVTQREWGRYYGMNLGYEFQKPNYLYAGIEGFTSLGNRFAEFKSEAFHTDWKIAAARNKIEGRFGYTLTRGELSFTPFIGAGGYFISETSQNMNIAYIPIGLKSDYRLGHFAIGLKAEQMHFIHLWQHSGDVKASLGARQLNTFGYEISLPVSFQANIAGTKWNGAFEPYFLKLFNSLAFIGGRISANHHF